MTGQEIIAARSLTLPSDNEDDDARRLEDAAELPFGNDAAEQQEHRPFNQTRSLFNKRNKIILGGCIGAILLMFVAGLFSSTALTGRNNKTVWLSNPTTVPNFNVMSLPPRHPQRPNHPSPRLARHPRNASPTILLLRQLIATTAAIIVSGILQSAHQTHSGEGFIALVMKRTGEYLMWGFSCARNNMM